MRFIQLFLILLVSTAAQSQNFKEKELKTTLNEVTVFLDGAQFFESGTTAVTADRSLLRITNLSPYINEKSIQVKVDGNVTILSVNHSLNYLTTLKNDRVVDSLKNLDKKVQSEIIVANARLDVLNGKQSVLDENKHLGGENSGTSIATLKAAMDFYDAELTKIVQEKLRINKEIASQQLERDKIAAQLLEHHDRKAQPTGEIVIRVRADHATTAKFSVSYLVAHAGWFPKYDVRVKDVSHPMELVYKAEVYQHTGVDWKNVKLRFSNATPNQSGMVPSLSPWMINYTRYTTFRPSSVTTDTREVHGIVLDTEGKVLPGVNVIVKGTTIGTVTDANGAYSIALPHVNAQLVFSFVGYSSLEVPVTNPVANVTLQEDKATLNEVVVVGYGTEGYTPGASSDIRIRGIRSVSHFDKPEYIPTTFVENQTTVEIEVKEPYTLVSGGEKLMVDLKHFDVPADFEYYAVPKLDNDAFLVAHIVKWDQYNLLEGEANLYFEDAYVGRSILNTKALSDTLSISLGRDKSIVINRTKVDQFNRRRTFGGNQIDSRGFRIVVKSKKSQPVKLTLFDQLPVSVNNDITVAPIDLSGAIRDEKSDQLTWHLTLEPQQQKEITLQYEVKYPKRESILLE